MAESFTLDMTDAQELGPLPTDIPYVFAISKFEYGRGGKENQRQVAAVFDVVQPDGVNNKIFDNINIENPNTKARYINILAALEEFGTKEQIKSNKKFKPPAEADVIGKQFCAFVRTQVDKTGQYSDKSVLTNRMFPVSEYERLTAAPAV